MKYFLHRTIGSLSRFWERGRERAYFCRLLALMCIGMSVSGCVDNILKSKVDEPSVYVLHTGTVATANVAYPVSLSVALPTATPGLDVNRIAVLKNHNQLDYFFGARWGGSAPQVMQSFLVSYLQAQQGLKSVNTDGLPVSSDYLLALELRDFQAEYASDTGAPTVRVTLSGSLIRISSRAAVTNLQASATVAAKDNRLSDVVTAFETAAEQASGEISAQMTKALGR